MISERSDGVPIHLAGIIFIIGFLVYLLKINLFCRKNKGVRERQIKEIFYLLCEYNGGESTGSGEC
ncbi:MAG: hypothetical protein E7D37_19540 [Enterobacter cloacae]|uniref:hypothetical protein n=1 Tax=Enterobacter cloacae TaxID=550 RepID=UPI0028FE7FFB|nr:hypothetical protein [Enterobacter cloacae]HCM9557402.1 hypothetical protein [Enterobacter cloacae subsp. cloacae]MDU2523155.1 hypothetical protein [Enterobacter cloacae]MDU2669676.1 hypothetical protein [Enterobacter cloacae]HDC4272917.1 hypothetical protein [Enterobacter cloacae]